MFLRQGTATYYALSLDYFRSWVGDVLLFFPLICQLFTYITFYWYVQSYAHAHTHTHTHTYTHIHTRTHAHSYITFVLV